LALAANRKAQRFLKALGLRRSDALIGEGVLNYAFRRIAGEPASELPLIGSLILGSVVLHRLRPLERLSLREMRVAVHHLRLDFDRRYGHLIQPNRPRR
jgi:hypothetical protein